MILEDGQPPVPFSAVYAKKDELEKTGKFSRMRLGFLSSIRSSMSSTRRNSVIMSVHLLAAGRMLQAWEAGNSNVYTLQQGRHTSVGNVDTMRIGFSHWVVREISLNACYALADRRPSRTSGSFPSHS